MIVVIDDERTFVNQWDETLVHLRTSQEAMLFFAEWATETNFLPADAMEDINQIWFDHDLGEESTRDATLVAKQVALIQKYDPSGILDDCLILVHSQNPVGAKNIKTIFNSLYLDCPITTRPRLEPN